MMSGLPLETYWAFKKLWNNKFYDKAASCWYFYWVIYDARIHEYQIKECIWAWKKRKKPRTVFCDLESKTNIITALTTIWLCWKRQITQATSKVMSHSTGALNQGSLFVGAAFYLSSTHTFWHRDGRQVNLLWLVEWQNCRCEQFILRNGRKHGFLHYDHFGLMYTPFNFVTIWVSEV